MINFEEELALLRHIRAHFSSNEIELRVDANSPGQIILKYHSDFLIKKRQNILISKEYHVFFRK